MLTLQELVLNSPTTVIPCFVKKFKKFTVAMLEKL